MANPPKRKGTAAETALLRWLHDNGHRDAVRNPPAGTKDVGDITARFDEWCDGAGGYVASIPVTVEVKNRADIAAAIREGLDELDAEMHNAGTDHGVLVLKPKGKGDPGDWYAIRRVRNDPEIGVL